MGVQSQKPRSVLSFTPGRNHMKPTAPRILCGILLVFCSFSFARAQQATATPAPKPSVTPAATAMPTPAPDQKAYDEARRIKDPEKKIEALEKVIKDFPDRSGAYQSRYDVFDTLVKNFPTQTDRIRVAA